MRRQKSAQGTHACPAEPDGIYKCFEDIADGSRMDVQYLPSPGLETADTEIDREDQRRSDAIEIFPFVIRIDRQSLQKLEIELILFFKNTILTGADIPVRSHTRL